MLRKKALLLLKIAISMGLIGYLLLKTDINALIRIAGQIKPLFFLFALLVSIFTILIRSYKWQLLLKLQRAKIPLEKTFINIENTANISAGTIPIALDQARKQSRIKEGDIVLLAAFGAGFTWGGITIKF